jgi:UDP-GlcNAc:undecaprenyl-phosphate/decaprenyl-phosphate GlcNAc-1-phosphate transferase
VELMLAFGLAFGFTLGLTPIVRAVARASGRVAQPTADRWHKRPTALFGGVGMFVGVLAGTVALYLLTRGGEAAAGLVSRR